MSPHNTHHNKNDLLDALLVLTIIIIPLYQLRVPIFSTSLSVLTFSCIILDLFFLSLYVKHIFHFLYNELLWIYMILFCCAFIPSLLLHPSTHAIGVFVEWIFVPLLTCFLISIHATHNIQSARRIFFALIASLFTVTILSLIYLFQDILTFDHRLTAFFLSPNHLALYITPLICIVGILGIYKNKFLHFFQILLAFSALCVLFHTQSFNTILALSCASLLYVFHISKNKLFLLFFIFLLTSIVFFTGYQKILSIDHDITHNSFGSRITIWQTTFFLTQKEPLFGYEIDSFQSHYLSAQKFFLPYPNWAVPTPHNLFLTLFFSGGFFSLLFFSIISSRILYILYTNLSSSKNRPVIFYGMGFITILCASVADTPFWKNDLSFLFWLFVVMIYIHSSSAQKCD